MLLWCMIDGHQKGGGKLKFGLGGKLGQEIGSDTCYDTTLLKKQVATRKLHMEHM